MRLASMVSSSAPRGAGLFSIGLGWVLTLAWGCFSPAALAGESSGPVPALSLESALKAARAALARCEADGYRVTVTVVDAGGTVKAVLRGDGAGPHTTDSSRKKAYTSASLRRSTRELSELVVKIPRLHSLGRMNDEILLLGGGLPIRQGERVVGGIGVGGAPGDSLDEACARAGLEALQP